MDGTVITKKGIQLLAKVIASKEMLNITRAAVGTGHILKGYDPSSMIDLVEYKMDASISGCNASGDIAEIIMQISSEGIETGFIITEIGVFAEDPDEGEILYAYVDISDDAQYIYPEGGEAIKFVEITLDVIIAEGANVTAFINPSSMVKREEFEEHTDNKNNPHNVTRNQIGLSNVDNTSDMDKPISHQMQDALNDMHEQLTAYTLQKISDLINGAPETMDTLKEVADAIANNQSVMDALNAAIGKKANAAEFDSHEKDAVRHITADERRRWDEKMEPTGDSENNILSFDSNDNANPDEWQEIGIMKSKEKHRSLMGKISIAIKNIRYLYKMLGTTTGAIDAMKKGLNGIEFGNNNLPSNLKGYWYKIATSIVQGDNLLSYDLDLIQKSLTTSNIYGKIAIGVGGASYGNKGTYLTWKEKGAGLNYDDVRLYIDNTTSSGNYRKVDLYIFCRGASGKFVAVPNVHSPANDDRVYTIFYDVPERLEELPSAVTEIWHGFGTVGVAGPSRDWGYNSTEWTKVAEIDTDTSHGLVPGWYDMVMVNIYRKLNSQLGSAATAILSFGASDSFNQVGVRYTYIGSNFGPDLMKLLWTGSQGDGAEHGELWVRTDGSGDQIIVAPVGAAPTRWVFLPESSKVRQRTLPTGMKEGSVGIMLQKGVKFELTNSRNQPIEITEEYCLSIGLNVTLSCKCRATGAIAAWGGLAKIPETLRPTNKISIPCYAWRVAPSSKYGVVAGAISADGYLQIGEAIAPGDQIQFYASYIASYYGYYDLSEQS